MHIMTINTLEGLVRTTASPQLTVLGDYYMSVTFSKEDMNNIISDPPPVVIPTLGSIKLKKTVGIMIRETRGNDGLLTLEAIKVTRDTIQETGSDTLPDLEAMSQKPGLPSVLGVSDKKPVTAKFRKLSNFGFVFFKKETIDAMLAYKPDKTTGLRFKRAKVEMEGLAMHQVLSVEPDPINTATGIERRASSLLMGGGTPLQDFVTYAIGYACPPNWPDSFLNGTNVVITLPTVMG
jgi:hypothetical protein